MRRMSQERPELGGIGEESDITVADQWQKKKAPRQINYLGAHLAEQGPAGTRIRQSLSEHIAGLPGLKTQFAADGKVTTSRYRA